MKDKRFSEKVDQINQVWFVINIVGAFAAGALFKKTTLSLEQAYNWELVVAYIVVAIIQFFIGYCISYHFYYQENMIELLKMNLKDEEETTIK